MKIELKYFGMIAEFLSKDAESIELDQNLTISDFRSQMEKKYPKLIGMDFRVAVNQTLVENNFKIVSDCELAFLPPFAGG